MTKIAGRWTKTMTKIKLLLITQRANNFEKRIIILVQNWWSSQSHPPLNLLRSRNLHLQRYSSPDLWLKDKQLGKKIRSYPSFERRTNMKNTMFFLTVHAFLPIITVWKKVHVKSLHFKSRITRHTRSSAY